MATVNGSAVTFFEITVVAINSVGRQATTIVSSGSNRGQVWDVTISPRGVARGEGVGLVGGGVTRPTLGHSSPVQATHIVCRARDLTSTRLERQRDWRCRYYIHWFSICIILGFCLWIPEVCWQIQTVTGDYHLIWKGSERKDKIWIVE